MSAPSLDFIASEMRTIHARLTGSVGEMIGTGSRVPLRLSLAIADVEALIERLGAPSTRPDRDALRVSADTVTVPRAVWDAVVWLVGTLNEVSNEACKAGVALDKVLRLPRVSGWSDTADALRALASAQAPEPVEPVADQRADREPGADALDAGAQALREVAECRALLATYLRSAGSQLAAGRPSDAGTDLSSLATLLSPLPF